MVCLNCTCLCLHIARVALVKCRDLHWAMMAHRDQKDINLSALRMLIVADGANPCEKYHHLHKQTSQPYFFGLSKTCIDVCVLGSVSSCDAFLNVFQTHGLKPEVICPCASSPEALTVAIRRYVQKSAFAP